MYTQCPKCETVFRLSAQVLRAAGGQVRCGRCGDVFDALTRLAEDAADFPRGESPLELETRADEILEFPATDAPVENVPPGEDIAQLQVLDTDIDAELIDELSLEFTLPPGELDRVFIETSPIPLQILTARTLRDVRPEPAQQMGRTHDPGIGPELGPALGREFVPQPGPDLGPALGPDISHAAGPDMGPEISPEIGGSGHRIAEHVRRDMLVTYEHTEVPTSNVPRRRARAAGWTVAAGVLALLLVVQFVRGNEWPTTAAVPTAYQLRQWGVTGDPAAKGTLRVRATVMNGSSELEPYPLLRVTLADRFGARIGQRDFEPTEYMGKGTARMLAPGERVEAALEIVDPGKDAEGFEIDVCVRGSGRRLACASDAAAHPQ